MSKSILNLDDMEKLDAIFGNEKLDYEFDQEQINQLDPEHRERFIRDKVRRIIRKLGEDGLSVEEIVEITGNDRRTIQKHLDALEGLREVYSQKKNKKLTLYYPNGRPLHQLGKKRFDWGRPIFEIYIAKGPEDKVFFYILEKKFTLMEGEVSEGAVMLPIEHLDEFIDALKEFHENIGGKNL